MMKDPTKPVKLAAFSQYPRGYQRPSAAGGGEVAMNYVTGVGLFSGGPSVSECILPQNETKGCTMGYTVVTRRNACEYRCVFTFLSPCFRQNPLL